MLSVITKADMPLPTAEYPLAQVEWLFFSKAKLATSKASSDKSKTVRKHFIAFLNSQVTGQVKKPYWVDDEFDEYIFVKFKSYIDDQNLPPRSAVTILSTFRRVLICAIENKWICLNSFVDFSIPNASRSTDVCAPFSDAEMNSIELALHAEIKFARGLLKSYPRSGRGVAPVIRTTKSCIARIERNWWLKEDNLVWHFENVMRCEPNIQRRDGKEPKDHFFVAVRMFGGIREFYRKIGVSMWIDQYVILPYVYKLVSITGLNPTVALSLSLDAFCEEHPLTGQPCIRYWKERGSGEGELHLNLLGNGVLPLDDKQAFEVRDIWREVKQLTQRFREELPVESRERLFVYQSRATSQQGFARDFLMDSKTCGNWTRFFVDKYKLKSSSGQSLTLNLSRFRPSLVSRMVRNGADIAIIQLILGHSSIVTTLRYLYENDINPVARREVQKALTAIRENRFQQLREPLKVADQDERHNVIFSTGMAFCKNVFNPPGNIRKAGGILPGSPCTYFNMCIKCHNVLIMEENLPLLFALRRQYLVAADQGLLATSHRAAIMQSIYILDSLLDPEVSDWSGEVLAAAETKSIYFDALVDPVAIRVVA